MKITEGRSANIRIAMQIRGALQIFRAAGVVLVGRLAAAPPAHSGDRFGVAGQALSHGAVAAAAGSSGRSVNGRWLLPTREC